MPELPFVVFILSASPREAGAFALEHLHPRQPWTWIEDDDQLGRMRRLQVVRLSSWQQRPDALTIGAALEARDVEFVTIGPLHAQP